MNRSEYDALLLSDIYYLESNLNGTIRIKPNEPLRVTTYDLRGRMYEDHNGLLMIPEEVEELSLWEIEDRGIHISEVNA